MSKFADLRFGMKVGMVAGAMIFLMGFALLFYGRIILSLFPFVVLWAIVNYMFLNPYWWISKYDAKNPEYMRKFFNEMRGR